MSLINYFEDGFIPSQTQKDIITKLDNSLNNNKKFIIINAPTGSGKSFIAKTLANYSDNLDSEFVQSVKNKKSKSVEYDDISFGGAYVLTITKSLQDQYINLFHDAALFKGKSNYNCALNTKLDCEAGACCGLPAIRKDCVVKNKCPYINAMTNLAITKFGVLNYSSFFKLPKQFKKRQFLICDEASELEDELVNNFSLNVTYKELKYFGVVIDKLPLEADSYTIKVWLEVLYNEVTECSEVCKQQIQQSISSMNITTNSKILARYKFLQNLEKSLCGINEGWDACEYVRDGDDEHVILSPLYVRQLSQHIFKHANTVVLMSATIINHHKFAETLGITDYDYIESDSSFESKKAPIYIAKNCEINYKNLDILLPKISNITTQICNKHSNVKGIIHTHTQKIANYIKDHFNDDRLTVRHGKITNEDVLKIHKDKINSVIVSPSMTFGVDLKDDLARFQIIIKLPFLPLGNKRIKILSTRDRDWYLMKMFTNLIQATGRGIRSSDDYCITYILDSTLIKLLINYNEYLPKYFVERFK